MFDFQKRAWKVGISCMVMHNEVAPGQHEFAPIYTVANAAADQNILSMDSAWHLCCTAASIVLANMCLRWQFCTTVRSTTV